MVQEIVDDILIWAPSLAALEDHLHKVLQRCSDLHITLSRSKFQIDHSLKFAGCIMSDEGVKPDPDRIAALSDFPVPTDQTGVRSFLGLCNQLALRYVSSPEKAALFSGCRNTSMNLTP